MRISRLLALYWQVFLRQKLSTRIQRQQGVFLQNLGLGIGSFYLINHCKAAVLQSFTWHAKNKTTTFFIMKYAQPSPRNAVMVLELQTRGSFLLLSLRKINLCDTMELQNLVSELRGHFCHTTSIVLNKIMAQHVAGNRRFPFPWWQL